MKLMIPVIAALALGASVQSSSAAIVLQDDFDGPTAQANWPGDAVFRSIPQPGNVSGSPSVDLVGPGFFQKPCVFRELRRFGRFDRQRE